MWRALVAGTAGKQLANRLTRRVDRVTACPVAGAGSTFLCCRGPSGAGRVVGMSHEGPRSHLSVVPRVNPPAEKRLCLNVYVSRTACALRARGYSAFRPSRSVRRRHCSPGFWPTPPNVGFRSVCRLVDRLALRSLLRRTGRVERADRKQPCGIGAFSRSPTIGGEREVEGDRPPQAVHQPGRGTGRVAFD